MSRRIVAGLLPAVLATATLLTLAMAGGAAAAPPRLSPPAPPEAPQPPTTARQAWLGVELQDVDADMAKALDLGEGEGALVNRVVEDSPAAAAGLADGDVIVSFDGRNVSSADDLTVAVREAKPGARVPVVVLRAGEKQTIKVQLGDRRLAADRPAPGPEIRPSGLADRMMSMHHGGAAGGNVPMMWGMGEAPNAFLGLLMLPLTEQLGRFFGAPDGEGALVSEVFEDSPAAAAGLEAGDVILRADDRPISGPADVRLALHGAEPGDKLGLTVLRDHAELTYEVTLGEPPSDPHASLPGYESGEEGTGNVYLHKMPRDHAEGMGGAWDDAGDGQRKVIIRRFAPEGDRGGDTEALREELQQLRKEVERLREEVDRQR
ncbi:MAG: PDZ domain-containing protein [Candidatus Krumholzibacteriia bacterium]